MPVAVTTISPPPARDLGVHVGHVHAVTERDLGPRDRFDRLRDRRALPGEARLLDLEGGRHEHPAVGRHLVAGLEAHDVPGHQVLGRDLHDLAVAPHAGGDDQHLPQRGDAFRSLALLVEPHQGVEDREAQHHEAGRDVLEGDDADDGRPDEHELHQVAVLAQERLPAGFLRLLGQLVRPVAGPPLVHLGG
jgi:hypothetical protein